MSKVQGDGIEAKKKGLKDKKHLNDVLKDK